MKIEKKSFFRGFGVIKTSNSCFWAKNTPRQKFYRFWTLQKEMAPRGIEPSTLCVLAPLALCYVTGTFY
jgi:hypothetical protein